MARRLTLYWGGYRNFIEGIIDNNSFLKNKSHLFFWEDVRGRDLIYGK